MANASVEESDRILMARLIRADEEAFGQFFDLVFPPLHDAAREKAASEDAAENLVKATLFDAVRSLDTWRGQMPVVAWVTRMLEEKWSAGGLAGDSAPGESVRSAVHAEWQAVTTRRAQRRVVTSLIFAIVVAFIILLFNCPPA